MSTSPHTPANPAGFNLVAGLAAAVLPGAGHFVLGEKKRGALVATGVFGLFFGGILIGGIDVIDSRDDRVWFFGQALVGPVAFAVDYVHQNGVKGIPAVFFEGPAGARSISEARFVEAQANTRSAAPGEARHVERVTVGSRSQDVPILAPAVAGETVPNIKSLSKVNELGTLFATIAGMLNVIVIVDAAMPGRRKV